MLFRKRMPKSCTYCVHGTQLDEEQILCAKRKIVPAASCCFRFKYDPCKRIPSKVKALDFDQYNNKDFTL